MFHTKMGDERVVVVMRNFGGGNLHQHSFTSKERLEVLLQLANILAKAIDIVNVEPQKSLLHIYLPF